MKKVYQVTLAVEIETEENTDPFTEYPIEFKAECNQTNVKVLEIADCYEVEV